MVSCWYGISMKEQRIEEGTMLLTAVAKHLNISTSAIKSIEEWATVLFVQFVSGSPRFVSKKVKKMTGNVEFINGNEHHSSFWGKFYVKGLEKWQVKEDGEYDRHNSNTEYVAIDIPEKTIFTVFEQDGNKRGTDAYYFHICYIDRSCYSEIIPEYHGTERYLKGNFSILASGKGKTKAPRLMNWWLEKSPNMSQSQKWDYAILCGESIKKRGVKEAPRLSA